MHALNLLIAPESEQCWLCGEEAQRDIQRHAEEKTRLNTRREAGGRCGGWQKAGMICSHWERKGIRPTEVFPLRMSGILLNSGRSHTQ